MIYWMKPPIYHFFIIFFSLVDFIHTQTQKNDTFNFLILAQGLQYNLLFPVVACMLCERQSCKTSIFSLVQFSARRINMWIKKNHQWKIQHHNLYIQQCLPVGLVSTIRLHFYTECSLKHQRFKINTFQIPVIDIFYEFLYKIWF